MNKTLGFGMLSTALALAACSEDPKGDDSSTTDPTGPDPTVTGPGTTTTEMPPVNGPGTGPATVSPTVGPPASTPAGTGGAGPVGMVFPQCGSATYTTQNVANDTIMFDGVRNIFFFGDNVTTACSQTAAGEACMYGEADTSVAGDNMYANWGAGMGLQLAADSANPWDATAAGVAGVKFTIAGYSGRPIRVQLSQVNDPAITDPAANYEENAFVWGGSSPMSVTADGEVEIPFTDFVLPNWTGLVDSTGTMLTGPVDPTKLHSLQVQIANNPPDMPATYGFCLSNLTWIDGNGNAVSVGLPDPVNTGGAGGMGGAGGAGGMGGAGGGMGGASGGMGGASGGMGGASGGMGGASGGMGGGGGEEVPTFAEVHAIFTAKCVPCHAEMMSGGRSHGLADAAAAYMSATTMPEEIADRINREEGAMGRMPPATAAQSLTEDEIATITAWVEGGTPE